MSWVEFGALCYFSLSAMVMAMAAFVMIKYRSRHGTWPHSMKMALSYVMFIAVMGGEIVAHPSPYLIVSALATVAVGFNGIWLLFDRYLVDQFTD